MNNATVFGLWAGLFAPASLGAVQIVDLGLGWVNARMTANGDVYRFISQGEQARLARYTDAGGLALLPSIPGFTSVVGLAVNNRGDIAVDYYVGGEVDARLTSIHPAAGGSAILGGPRDSFSLGGMNDSGVVVGGRGEWASAPTRAFRHAPGAGIELLPTFGGPYTWATGINEAGQIVGASFTHDLGARAFRFTPGAGMLMLGSLGGDTVANAINARGDVVGGSWLGLPTVQRAFLHTDARGFQDLGALPGHSESYAHAINDHGWVVGASYGAGILTFTAFLWTPETGMIDLNTFIDPASNVFLTEAFEVNDPGQILALARVDGQYDHIVRITGIPSPGPAVVISSAGAVAPLRPRKRPHSR